MGILEWVIGVAMALVAAFFAGIRRGKGKEKKRALYERMHAKERADKAKGKVNAKSDDDVEHDLVDRWLRNGRG